MAAAMHGREKNRLAPIVFAFANSSSALIWLLTVRDAVMRAAVLAV